MCTDFAPVPSYKPTHKNTTLLLVATFYWKKKSREDNFKWSDPTTNSMQTCLDKARRENAFLHWPASSCNFLARLASLFPASLVTPAFRRHDDGQRPPYCARILHAESMRRFSSFPQAAVWADRVLFFVLIEKKGVRWYKLLSCEIHLKGISSHSRSKRSWTPAHIELTEISATNFFRKVLTFEKNLRKEQPRLLFHFMKWTNACPIHGNVKTFLKHTFWNLELNTLTMQKIWSDV